MEKVLPPIPAKRYFTIGEVSDLCGVKPYVLRYWEQEFTQLKPVKRRGNRRYYQHHEVLLIRRIRDLLYEQGFTISGARNRLGDAVPTYSDDEAESADGARMPPLVTSSATSGAAMALADRAHAVAAMPSELPDVLDVGDEQFRNELIKVRDLLTV
jgi:DNA-binding transcriptional MerR regulator